MRRVSYALVLCATLAVVAAPVVAHADGYISPFIGTNFGNNSGNGRTNVGADVGWMGGGIIGAEVDFGYAPSFFGSEGTFGSNSVMDLMGNVVLGIPVGGTKGIGVRPYVTGGIGLIRSRFDGPAGTASTITNDEAGMNAGAGVTGYLSNHLGIRGDVRYFRNLTDGSTENNANIDFGAFHFWRASVGIVIRP